MTAGHSDCRPIFAPRRLALAHLPLGVWPPGDRPPVLGTDTADAGQKSPKISPPHTSPGQVRVLYKLQTLVYVVYK